MNIEYVKIKELQGYEFNTRTHSDSQVNQLAASIGEFGFTNPLLIDGERQIIAGHGRFAAATKLQMDEVPCIVLDHLSEAQRRAYVIADNKLALNAGWDEDLLKLELSALDKIGFDLSVVGFDADELSGLVIDEDIAGGLTDEDDVPEVPEDPISKLGDIWMLGKHRVMCGDSVSVKDVGLLMNGETADMCFTDPPYLMDFTGGIHADGSKSFNAKHGEILNDKMSKQDGENFLDDINLTIKNNVSGAFYITFYRLGIDGYFNSLERVGLKYRSLIIWNKGNHTLSNSDYMSMYEPIFYGWVNDHKFYGGNNGMDIWDIKRTKKNDLHPTMKPVELIEKALDGGSKKDDLILDIFLGSGSTLIGCEKKGRKCYGMELEPKYVDVIIKRWQEYTGQEATLEDTGESFNEVADAK